MPKGAHLRKQQDLKKVKSILLRFTQQEFIQLQNYCKGLGIERSEMVRDAVFKTINFQQKDKPAASAKQPALQPEVQPDLVALHLQTEKTVHEFLEDLVIIYREAANKRGFNRKIDCNIYRANTYEFTKLLEDYSQKALTEEFKHYCNELFSSEFLNSHLLRGFEIHISNNFVFWNKHNRGSSNYVGY